MSVSNSKNKILLIEDETNVVSFIRKGLTEEGFEVEVSLTGEEGLQNGRQAGAKQRHTF